VVSLETFGNQLRFQKFGVVWPVYMAFPPISRYNTPFRPHTLVLASILGRKKKSHQKIVESQWAAQIHQHVLQFRYDSKEIWIPNHFFGSLNMLLQRGSSMGEFPQCVLEHVVHECEE
jgi:hypothetical protein